MAYTTDSTVVAAFRNSADAQAAATDLQSAGISRADIYLESQSATAGAGTEATDSYGSRMARHEGGIAGWFKSLFGPEEAETEHVGYQRAVEQGGYLLSVDAREDQFENVEEILNRHSPLNVHSDDTSTYNSAAAGPASSTANTSVGNTATASTTGAIPVVEEDLQVGKRRVLRGGIRVFSRLVEKPVEENIGLSEDHVHVDRKAVNRPATSADFGTGRDQVIEVEEYGEDAVVAKQARVVEEINVGKDTTSRTETVRDTLRHTEVEVEKLPGGGAGAADHDQYFRRDFQTRYGSTGDSYDTYSPAYQYGSTMAADPRYKGRQFSDVESDLRTDYARRYPSSTWDKMKDSIQTGWNKVTGK